MFPFTITQERALGKSANIESTVLIEAIRNELHRLQIYTYEYNDVEIDFKIKFFSGHGRNHLMSAVDKGTFKIDKRSDRIIYSYSILRMFYITVAMMVIMGFASRSILFTLGGFVWIFGFGGLITFIRHYLFMNRIKKMLLKLENVSSK